MTNDEKGLREVIAAGKDADAWLNHPQFKHVIMLMKAELIGQFEKTSFKDKEEREEIWRKIQAINGLKNRMERIIRDGDKANMSLLDKIKQKVKK